MTIDREIQTPDTLGGVGELAALKRIFPRLPSAASELIGPGDDSAVLATPDKRVVITTDMMIHGPDFRMAWSRPYDLGWKAAATNLSDVAAMGAVPTGLVVAIAAPNDTPVSSLEAIADGLREGCESLAPGSGVIGGDLSVSTVLTIVITAFGDLEGRAPVLRSGACVGDVIAVSGTLGLAAEGLRLLFTEGIVDGEPDAAADAVGGRVQLDGGEDHSLLATFPDGVPLPAGFRAIGRVVEGEGLLVDGVAYTERGGWDPYAGWDGAAG